VVGFRFLRPLAVCDQALPRPTEGEDTQSTPFALARFMAALMCLWAGVLAASGFAARRTGSVFVYCGLFHGDQRRVTVLPVINSTG
jgi:hypothetical protein